MPGEGFSGKNGTATVGGADVFEVTKWTLDPTNSVPKYHSNKTGGHRKGVVGVRDTKGTIEIKISDSTGQQLGPGANIALALHLDETGANYFAIAEAIISGTPIDCDVDGGEIVGLTYSFEASDCTGNGLVAAVTTEPAS